MFFWKFHFFSKFSQLWRITISQVTCTIIDFHVQTYTVLGLFFNFPIDNHQLLSFPLCTVDILHYYDGILHILCNLSACTFYFHSVLRFFLPVCLGNSSCILQISTNILLVFSTVNFRFFANTRKSAFFAFRYLIIVIKTQWHWDCTLDSK